MDKSEIDNIIEKIEDEISSEEISKLEKDEILSELNSVLDAEPNNTNALMLKAMVYQFTEDYENAAAIYEELLKIEPDNKYFEENFKDCKQFMEWQLEKENSFDTSVNSSKSYDKLLEKVSIWHILIFKAIVIAIVIYIFFVPLFVR